MATNTHTATIDPTNHQAWYVLYCKAREEERARHNIENQGYTTCLPQIKRQKIVRGKRTDRIEALFPNYIFVQINTETANFNALRSTRGVREFIRFGGTPATVPEQVMQSLLELEKIGHKQNNGEPAFNEGDKVRITEGPFSGLEAIYQMPKGEERCLVFLNMLGQQQRIEVDEIALRSD